MMYAVCLFSLLSLSFAATPNFAGHTVACPNGPLNLCIADILKKEEEEEAKQEAHFNSSMKALSTLIAKQDKKLQKEEKRLFGLEPVVLVALLWAIAIIFGCKICMSCLGLCIRVLETPSPLSRHLLT